MSIRPRAFPLLLQLILEAWRHGRQAPAMMEIEWEAEWQHSIDDIRKRYDIKPYRSVLPANMLEVFGRWGRGGNASDWAGSCLGY